MHQGDSVVKPSQDLIDQLYREEILLARRIPPEEKLLDGLRLFQRTCGLGLLATI